MTMALNLGFSGDLGDWLRGSGLEIVLYILGGMLIVVVVYLLCNICYLSVLPAFDARETVPSLVSSPVAAVSTAEEAARLVLPAGLAALAPATVAAFISISGVGSSNVTVMTGGRYLYAVARDGQAPYALSRLSRWQTPITDGSG